MSPHAWRAAVSQEVLTGSAKARASPIPPPGRTSKPRREHGHRDEDVEPTIETIRIAPLRPKKYACHSTGHM
jgi:hypothetical protein